MTLAHFVGLNLNDIECYEKVKRNGSELHTNSSILCFKSQESSECVV